MNNMNEENKTYIKDIKNSIIPDYQRGYKWEIKNVEDLLNDIDGIDNTEKKEHCLHNLTIIEKDNNKWEIIDGQQRLTTIFLILKYLDKEYYKLSYKIRKETESFLSEIDNIIKSLKENEDENNLFNNKVKENNKYDKQDIYYICQALSTIHNWFKDKKEQEKSFIEKLESNVYFYKHKIENEIIKGETVFANLNSGKVALTDIELIKADLIINISIKKAKDKENEILINEIRSNIGRLWDEMESWLAQDEVWYWISPKKNETNKLTLLFNLCEEFNEGNNIYEKYYNYIYKNKTDEDATEKLQKVWEKIINYYYTIKDWYLDNDMYHLIGIIIYFDIKIKEFLGNKYSTKNELKNKLKSNIIEKVKLITENNELKFKEINKEINYVELNYVEKREDLNKIFILLNCLEGYNNDKNIFYEHFRYRFDIHNKNKWSIEHIIPQKLKDIINSYKVKNDDKKVKEIIKEIENELNINLCNRNREELISSEENKLKEKLTEENLEKYLDRLIDIHTIGNLALLEVNVNSSLKNNIFKEKRKILLKKVDEGSFIPPLTLKVFSKTFIDADTEKDYWTDNDFNEYEKYQEKQLKKFINPLNEKGNNNNE